MCKNTDAQKKVQEKETQEKEAKLSMGQAWKLHIRAFKIWWERAPLVFVASFLFTLVRVGIPYVEIYFSAQLINELSGECRPDSIRLLVLVLLLVTAGLYLVRALAQRFKNWKHASCYDIEQKIYADKLMNMDFSALDEQHTFDLRAQIHDNFNWNFWGLRRIILYFDNLCNAVFRILGAVLLTVSLFTIQVPETAGALAILNHPLFVLLFLGVLGLVSFLSPVLANKAEYYYTMKTDDIVFGNRCFFTYAFMANDQSRALDIRIYEQEKISDGFIRRMNGEKSPFSYQSGIGRLVLRRIGPLRAASAAVSFLFLGIVYVFVCLKAWAGAFGIGSITQYIGAITALSQGLSEMLLFLGGVRANGEFLKVTFAFLDIPNHMYQGSLTTEKREDKRYEVEFRDVSFQYPGSDSYALRHVSMKFEIGKRLAVVGRNGSGKTTFIKLLCRLYDPTEGQILLNGIDIAKYNYREYMSIFSVVFQDFQLLAFPLAQNVAASFQYEEERVRECLQKAGFEERQERLEQGIETCLYREFDERGVEVSGGEAQKIAIARALYKDAAFLILDEPTAALDPVAEYEIYTKLDEIIEDKTTIYISHRLSSCRFCDEVVVFENGTIVEQGSHEKLVKDTSTKYYELWNAQAQYYREEKGAAE